MTDSPFRIDLFDKTRVWQGRLGNPVAVDGSVKCNALGNFQIRVAADDPMATFLLAKGARASMSYLPATERGNGSTTFSPLMSGMVRTNQGSVLSNGDIVFQLQDDWRDLINTIAWVAPFQPIAPTVVDAIDPNGLAQATLPGGGSDAGPNGQTQGQYGYYLWPDGSAASGGVLVQYAEDAIKDIVNNNFFRLGRPVTVAPALHRGGDARAAGILPMVRMTNLAEAIQPLLDWSGLVLTMFMPFGLGTPQKTLLDVRVPATWPAPLTVGSGIIQDGSWSTSAPNATRSIVGGPGEDVARAFWRVLDTSGLEADYGDIIEVFRDAAGASLTWPTAVTELFKIAKYFLLRAEPDPADQAQFMAYLNAAGNAGLSDGAPQAAASVSLSETQTFYFGGAAGVQLGDYATVQTAAGALFTERITEAQFSLTKDGFTVTPILGNATDDPMQTLANAVAALAASQRRVSTSR